MSEAITQCPACQTSFRVSAEQMVIAAGSVRCGACLNIFQAERHFLSPPLNLDERLAIEEDYWLVFEQYLLQVGQPPVAPTWEVVPVLTDENVVPDADKISALNPLAAPQREAIADSDSDDGEDPNEALIEYIWHHRSPLIVPLKEQTRHTGSDDSSDPVAELETVVTAESQALLDSPKWVDSPEGAVDEEPVREPVLTEPLSTGPFSTRLTATEPSATGPSAAEPSATGSSSTEFLSHDHVFSEHALSGLKSDGPSWQPASIADASLVDVSLEPVFDSNLSPNVIASQDSEHTDPETAAGPDGEALDLPTVESPGQSPGTVNWAVDAPADDVAPLHPEQDWEEYLNLADEPSMLDADAQPGMAKGVTSHADQEVVEDMAAFELPMAEMPDIILAGERKRPFNLSVKWLPGITLMLLALMAQYAFFSIDRYAQNPDYRPWYETACRTLGCQLPDYANVSELMTRDLVVRPHPDAARALLLDVLLLNVGPYRQEFPELRLNFFDINGSIVAARVFEVDEYLGGELRGLKYIPAVTEVRLSLAIAEPGPHALGYEMVVASP